VSEGTPTSDILNLVPGTYHIQYAIMGVINVKHTIPLPFVLQGIS